MFPSTCAFDVVSDEVCSLIATRGGLERVLSAMRSCEAKADVQMYGAWALANIAWSDPRIKQRAVAAGGSSCLRVRCSGLLKSPTAGAIEACEAAIERFGRKEPGVSEKADLAIRTIMSE